MNNSEYKDLELISLNVAGWNWRVTNEKWGDRLKRICEYIKNKMNNPLVIALQEVQLSGGKYLTVLKEQFPNYHIVLPQAYKNQPCSVVSVLLINKNLCESYNIRTLEELDNSLRYNYVQINTHIEGLCFRILNIHLPHNCLEDKAEWYREEREELRALFMAKIKELANIHRSESDLKLVILGDYNVVPDDTFIKSLAYSYDRPMIDAVKDCDKHAPTWRDRFAKTKNRVDYVLYSTGMFCNREVSAKFTLVDETTIFQELSDHAMLVGGLRLDKDLIGEKKDDDVNV